MGKGLNRLGGGLKKFLFKDLPPLSAAQAAQLKKAGELSGKGLDKLTKGIRGNDRGENAMPPAVGVL